MSSYADYNGHYSLLCIMVVFITELYDVANILTLNRSPQDIYQLKNLAPRL